MKHDGNDLLRRHDCIEAIEGITCSMSLCVNADECHGMQRMRKQAVIELANMPAAQPESSTDIDNALALLDGIRSAGRMEYYSDYCTLHDAISQISAQPDRKLIDDYMWKIKQNISPHTAAEGVIAIKYYLEQIYEQIYGEGEKPKWMT